jgi:hypothetical protein
VAFLGLAVGGGALVATAVAPVEEEELTVVTAPPALVPATLPPPTTAPPATTTTTVAPDGEDDGTDDGGEPAATTLPPGPPERPEGLVAGLFWDALVGAGADPGVANCAAVRLTTETSEADLLAEGIANDPRPPEVTAKIGEAARACGVPEEVLATLAG